MRLHLWHVQHCAEALLRGMTMSEVHDMKKSNPRAIVDLQLLQVHKIINVTATMLKLGDDTLRFQGVSIEELVS